VNLTELSSSPLPNGLAVIATVLLVLAAFAMKASTPVRWGFVLVAVTFGLTVISKNFWYYFIISRPKAENDSVARAGYAEALLWITIGQLVCAIAAAEQPIACSPSTDTPLAVGHRSTGSRLRGGVHAGLAARLPDH
jgi:hypothetical protein